jgi:predicted aconitase with swiveling domain
VGLVSRFRGEVIVGRQAHGSALVADVPLSFWGGFDPEQGTIIDWRHPLIGEVAANRILVLPSGRGSCSGSGVLFEAIHNELAPEAIILSHIDPIIGLGCILGQEVYGRYPALLVVSDADRQAIASGDTIDIDDQGWVTVTRPECIG